MQTFESWKKQKDEVLKEQHHTLKATEKEKMTEEERKKEEKQKEAEKYFKKWSVSGCRATNHIGSSVRSLFNLVSTQVTHLPFKGCVRSMYYQLYMGFLPEVNVFVFV